MKILLVYPQYPDTFWSFKHALKFVSKKAAFPPLGLLTVAAMLPQDWEKKLVDMDVTVLTDKDIRWADYVFISAMAVQKESVKGVVSRCKELGAKIVAGGPLFTAGFEEFADVDYFVNLTDSSIFNTSTLRPLRVSENSYPTITQGPVLAKLCDTMDVTFNYLFKADKPVSGLNTKFDLTAIVTAPNLWTRSFPLLHKTSNTAVFKTYFAVNLDEYVQFINSVISESSVSGDSFNIIIQADISTTANSQYGIINDQFKSSLKGTVKNNILDWDKETSTTRTGSIKENTAIPNKSRTSRITIFAILVGILFVFCAFSIVLYRKWKPTEISLFVRETTSIKKKYGQRIATMTDLVKIADELGKPIIQQTGETAVYYVFDSGIRYEYKIKDGNPIARLY
jgi:hypothetical protein